MSSKSVLFVCLGNICRSPAAEGICRSMAKHLHVDSCGTGPWHVGQHPDSRSITACKNHNIDIKSHVARTIKKNDWQTFDVIAALDQSIYNELKDMMPAKSKSKLVLFNAPRGIDDPYYGGQDGFENMYSIISGHMPTFLKENDLLE
ncbi:low molecular weight phosphotyrosine protein phosphatase, putative [Trichomonas vaginalis G3]|uniref:Low molecular weight phosphotyrosine protein phosphatase, putative n=1 Tax=Trichomonas vaginalis (strain ATCC PRA-98 / G3) TaxID=412133 RepID=A2EK34_TRIV3|nr:non-membrane spanning protein tyrosine phosphatase protein [Trichomonas vaginalis G3]EAY07018.1 low molecular weight phosphotyrosine protein phosphatase, putative [Trichomonas vaginalis G3]KAI5488802.1 non-membrane spanning protein tyrosine phosphatase protein [Trichomonas vaginalis G3]|eukprot:XP_001319241.1 low molecular weight phosphotyrosine protein phosphatase [Trichomonas vaginalis G3]